MAKTLYKADALGSGFRITLSGSPWGQPGRILGLLGHSLNKGHWNLSIKIWICAVPGYVLRKCSQGMRGIRFCSKSFAYGS